ncbi:MAG: glycosyltransferase domain-containing protein, partial [bacterium]
CRDCVYDEIDYCAKGNDRPVDNEFCQKAIEKYRLDNYPKKNGLFENAFIIRQNSKNIQKLNEKWWQEFSDGAERDQFYLMYCLWKLGIKPNPISYGEQFRKSFYVNFFKHEYKQYEINNNCTRYRAYQNDISSLNCSKNNTEVTVITPTGDRFAALNRCIQWVMTQTRLPDQWIIVDDGSLPANDVMRIPKWATYIRRERKDSDPPHTLSINILTALEYVMGDKIFIVEDDDWYSKNYIEYLLPYLESYNLVGTNLITYYHLQGRVYKTGKPKYHTALAQTAFTKEAIPCLRETCSSSHWEIRERGIVDRHWWHSFEGNKLLIQEHPIIHVGLKGLFGRKGIAEGHLHTSWGYKPDNKLEYLSSILGEDVEYYRFWADGNWKPFAIYTCISHDYDSLKEPIHENPLFDFYVFSDKEQRSDIWNFVPFDECERNDNITAKKPKILPHLYFPHYSHTIFIDANIFILEKLNFYIEKLLQSNSAIGQFMHRDRDSIFDEAQYCSQKNKCVLSSALTQISRYKKEGFNDSMLPECNFLVRNHNDENLMRSATLWWNEVCANKDVDRDQISYPYALWKYNLQPCFLKPKGYTVRNANELYYVKHGRSCFYDYEVKIRNHIYKNVDKY